MDNGKTLKIVFRTTNHKAFILNGAKSKEMLQQEFLEVSFFDLLASTIAASTLPGHWVALKIIDRINAGSA